MADHLPAGRVGDAEVAIKEELAQAFAREVGIAWLDVGECFDDGVLIYDGLHLVGAITIVTSVQIFGSVAFAASAHFPKFVLHCRTIVHELRKVMGTSKSIILVPLSI